MILIGVRPHKWGWRVFEAPGVEPVFHRLATAPITRSHRSVPPLLSEIDCRRMLCSRMRDTRFIYEIRPAKLHRTFDLTSRVLPLGRAVGFLDAAAAVRYAKSYSDPHAVNVMRDAWGIEAVVSESIGLRLAISA
jgi:hypothetical protein